MKISRYIFVGILLGVTLYKSEAVCRSNDKSHPFV